MSLGAVAECIDYRHQYAFTSEAYNRGVAGQGFAIARPNVTARVDPR